MADLPFRTVLQTMHRRIVRTGLAGVLLIACASGAALAFSGPLAALFVGLSMATVFYVPGPGPGHLRRSGDPVTGLACRDSLVQALDRAVTASARGGAATGAIVFEIDAFKLVEERFDRAGVEVLYRKVAKRIANVLRDTDRAARLEGPVFAIALSPMRRLDLESAIQLSSRIQQVLAEPIEIGDTNIYITVSVGFSLAASLDRPTGDAILQAATTAAIEAQRAGPGAIRSYSESMRDRIVSRNSLSLEVDQALKDGQIQAFFQPQVSTETGRVTGVETLARWRHPERGLIPPIEFLPALEHAGLMDKLGGHMVSQALSALGRWDAAGLDVPRIAVNFSGEELRNPHLVDLIAFELDRCDLTAERLSIEVLETVVAEHSEDLVLRNLAALAQLGCYLDLDDFGTGHASITSIRRFSVERIKIDRSFVTDIDRDSDQQMMVSAILTMAERLGLDTLAEGVETEAELARLAQLGCGHVQGYGIARPMPADDMDRWLVDRQGGTVRSLPRRAG